MKKKTWIFATVASLSLVLAACGGTKAGGDTDQAGWQPSQPVAVIVPYGAGGGTDIVFRQLIQIINDEELSNVKWVVENRDGGSGTTGMRYVIAQESNDHTLMGTTPGHISVPSSQSMEISIADLTPVANTLIDPQVLWTYKGSKYTTVDAIVQALRDKPKSVSIGGAPVSQDDHLTTLLFNRATDTTTKYVPFSGGGEIKTALLGGQVDLAWLNPSEASGQTVAEGGTLVPIAVALKDRLKALPDVPTFSEEGFDVVYDMFFRGLTAPPGVSREIVEYYAGVVRKATETAAWGDFVDKSQVEAQYMDAKAFKTALDEWTKEINDLLDGAS